MTDQKPECDCPARKVVSTLHNRYHLYQSDDQRSDAVIGAMLEGMKSVLAIPCPCCKERDELAAEHERLLAYARKVKGSRDVHSVYEVLDCLVAERDRLRALLAEAKLEGEQ